MSQIRFYFDEHIANAIADGLRRRGFDVLTLAEAGRLGTSDEAHLEYALEQQRVLVTHDADFLRLAARGLPHAGIVYSPQGRTVGDMIRTLTLIAQVLTAEEMHGRIEYV
ncbi:MAG: DUF5615 family PIN-like protein [Bacteroidota bacterium]